MLADRTAASPPDLTRGRAPLTRLERTRRRRGARPGRRARRGRAAGAAQALALRQPNRHRRGARAGPRDGRSARRSAAGRRQRCRWRRLGPAGQPARAGGSANRVPGQDSANSMMAWQVPVVALSCELFAGPRISFLARKTFRRRFRRIHPRKQHGGHAALHRDRTGGALPRGTRPHIRPHD